MSSIRFSITVTPDQLWEIRGLPVTPAHLAYRVGQGAPPVPHRRQFGPFRWMDGTGLPGL